MPPLWPNIMVFAAETRGRTALLMNQNNKFLVLQIRNLTSDKRFVFGVDAVSPATFSLETNNSSFNAQVHIGAASCAKWRRLYAPSKIAAVINGINVLTASSSVRNRQADYNRVSGLNHISDGKIGFNSGRISG